MELDNILVTNVLQGTTGGQSPLFGVWDKAPILNIMIVIRYNDSSNFAGISIYIYFIYFLSLMRIIHIEPVTIKYLREIDRMYKWYCLWDFIG